MDTPTHTDIWQALPPDARARACAAFWQADDEMTQQVRPSVLAKLATSLKFREKFLKAQPESQKAALLLRRASQPEFRLFHGDLLRALLLADHGKLIEQFLDVQGIPRRGCFLDSEAPPKAASFRKGIQAIRATWGDGNAALYLVFTLAHGEDEFWAALPQAITDEGLDVQSALAGIAKPS